MDPAMPAVIAERTTAKARPTQSQSEVLLRPVEVFLACEFVASEDKVEDGNANSLPSFVYAGFVSAIFSCSARRRLSTSRSILTCGLVRTYSQALI